MFYVVNQKALVLRVLFAIASALVASRRDLSALGCVGYLSAMRLAHPAQFLLKMSIYSPLGSTENI